MSYSSHALRLHRSNIRPGPQGCPNDQCEGDGDDIVLCLAAFTIFLKF